MKFSAMKTKVASSLVALGLSVAVVGCASRLDINPINTIDGANALSTDQGVKVALTGAYAGSNLGSANLLGGAMMYCSEFLADDGEARFAGTFQGQFEVWAKQMVSNNALATGMWSSAYVTINQTNLVLANLDKVVTRADKEDVEGEARFIRGLLYFELAKYYGRFWGDGDQNTNLAVPLVLTPTTAVSDADNRPRATVAAVYAQAISDLTRAEQLLLEGSDGTRATKSAAAAVLSRVYLAQGDFARARDAAQRVIAANVYSLAATFDQAFNEAAAGYTRENIFRMSVTAQTGTNNMQQFYSPAALGGRGDVRIQASHLTRYEAGDVRAGFFNISGGNRFSNKWNVQFNDVAYIRFAEMLLTRAECNFRLGTTIGAAPLADVNAIRTRAGLPALTQANLTLDRILAERRLELAFEGQLLWDLKRNRATTITANPARSWTNPLFIFPIPQREIDTNPNLVQNAGY